MRTTLRRVVAATLFAALACSPPVSGIERARAQDDPFDLGGRNGDGGDGRDGGDGGAETPDAVSDASTALFEEALELQRKRKWSAAKKLAEKLLKQYPQTIHASEIDLHFGENQFLGVEPILIGGPSSRRIDVALMGDGFVLEKKEQKTLGEWAEKCMNVLFVDDAFDTYRDYFNFRHVRLASAEEGVDDLLSPEAKAKIDERNKKKRNKTKYAYNTALDCKAAGPQGQVVSDRGLVYKWLEVAERAVPGTGDDRLVIVFAKFGKLGMGGGGIANCGKPDESVTVHEFGHAFVGLLDEYANSPGPPQWKRPAPNVSYDPLVVPWQHFLDAGVKGVKTTEGGATYKKGAWRPAKTCAMNSAGNTQGFCPVCREAAVLRIYSYVNPIDASSPATDQEVDAVQGGDAVLSVVPMQPRKHELDADWIVETIALDLPGPVAEEPSDSATYAGGRRPRRGRFLNGDRGRDETRPERFEKAPEGDPSRLGRKVKGGKGEPTKHQFPLGRLQPGRYKITVQVKDSTDWVLKDTQHLLEERLTWFVTVRPKP